MIFRKSPPMRGRERADKESPRASERPQAVESRRNMLHIARVTIMISQHDRKKDSERRAKALKKNGRFF